MTTDKQINDVVRDLNIDATHLLKYCLGKKYKKEDVLKALLDVLRNRWDGRRQAGPPAGYINPWPVHRVREWAVAWPVRVTQHARERWDSNPGTRAMYASFDAYLFALTSWYMTCDRLEHIENMRFMESIT